jgi:hypothetical protein
MRFSLMENYIKLGIFLWLDEPISQGIAMEKYINRYNLHNSYDGLNKYLYLVHPMNCN